MPTGDSLAGTGARMVLPRAFVLGVEGAEPWIACGIWPAEGGEKGHDRQNCAYPWNCGNRGGHARGLVDGGELRGPVGTGHATIWLTFHSAFGRPGVCCEEADQVGLSDRADRTCGRMGSAAEGHGRSSHRG